MNALYVRVSTAYEGRQKSLRNYQQHWNQIIKEQNLIPYPGGMLAKRSQSEKLTNGIFADVGISGTSLNNRTAFNSLIKIALKGEIKNIYFENMISFARDVEKSIPIIRKLSSAGVVLHFEDENIIADNPDRYFDLVLHLVLLGQESKKMSNRTKSELSKIQQQGAWVGREPYGYKLVDKHLEVIPHQAEVVKNIYELFNSGCSIANIVRYLNDKNILTQRGTKWGHSQVTSILENPIYTGKKVKYKEQMLNANTPQILHHIPSLKIVDDELYKSVQEELLRRREINKLIRYSFKQNLSNTLYCSSEECYDKKISQTDVKVNDIINADSYSENIQQVNVQQLQQEKDNLSSHLSQLRSDKIMGIVPDSVYSEETRLIAKRIDEINHLLNEYSRAAAHNQHIDQNNKRRNVLKEFIPKEKQ